MNEVTPIRLPKVMFFVGDAGLIGSAIWVAATAEGAPTVLHWLFFGFFMAAAAALGCLPFFLEFRASVRLRQFELAQGGGGLSGADAEVLQGLRVTLDRAVEDLGQQTKKADFNAKALQQLSQRVEANLTAQEVASRQLAEAQSELVEQITTLLDREREELAQRLEQSRQEEQLSAPLAAIHGRLDQLAAALERLSRQVAQPQPPVEVPRPLPASEPTEKPQPPSPEAGLAAWSGIAELFPGRPERPKKAELPAEAVKVAAGAVPAMTPAVPESEATEAPAGPPGDVDEAEAAAAVEELETSADFGDDPENPEDDLGDFEAIDLEVEDADEGDAEMVEEAGEVAEAEASAEVAAGDSAELTEVAEESSEPEETIELGEAEEPGETEEEDASLMAADDWGADGWGEDETEAPLVDEDLPGQSAQPETTEVSPVVTAKVLQPDLLGDVEESRFRARKAGRDQTTLIAQVLIGIGNKPFVRGDGPGLSLEKGVPMEFLEIGKWQWATGDATEPFRVQIYKNDNVPSADGWITLEPGQRRSVTPRF